MWSVHLHHGRRLLVLTDRLQDQRPGTGRPHHLERGHDAPATGHRANCPLERHVEPGGADDEHDQCADEPADGQPEQRPRGDHGADDEMDRHERQQQRPPPAPPPRGQPGPRDGQHRGEHRDPARVVDELGRQRVEAVGEVEMPLRRRDACVGDRQRQPGDRGRGRIRTEQFPLARDDKADQDHERQRQDRDAVNQVDQVGLGGSQDGDDLGHGPLEGDPLVAGDQRAGDDNGQEHRGQGHADDVVGPAGQRLQQAARDGDVPPVNSHVSRIFPMRRAGARLADTLAADLCFRRSRPDRKRRRLPGVTPARSVLGMGPTARNGLPAGPQAARSRCSWR